MKELTGIVRLEIAERLHIPQIVQEEIGFQSLFGISYPVSFLLIIWLNPKK